MKNTRLDVSYELAYLQKYQGKQFNISGVSHDSNYVLGCFNQENQRITVTWDDDEWGSGSTTYELGYVLKNLLLNIWIIK